MADPNPTQPVTDIQMDDLTNDVCTGGLPSDEELLGSIDNPRNNTGPSDAGFQQSNQGPLT